MDLSSRLHQVAIRNPDAAAMIFRGHKIGYGELDSRIQRCAAGLAGLGVKQGDRFGLMMKNCPEFVVIYYALARLGAIAVPINFLLKPAEVSYIFEHAGVVGAAVQPSSAGAVRQAAAGLPAFRHLICTGPAEEPGDVSYDELLKSTGDVPEVEVSGSDVACIIYTSGTTGKPKGVMLTHGNLLSNIDSCRDAIRILPQDIFMCLLPMFHTFAWTTCVLLPLSLGNATVVVESIQPFKEVAAQVHKHRVSIFMGVPPIFAAMAKMPFWKPLRFLLPLRLCISGGAPLPRGVLERFEAKFGLPLLEGYGLTETSPVVSLNPPEGEHRPGTVGICLPGIEVKVFTDAGVEATGSDVGEICVRGRNVMLGYYRDPDATAAAIDQEGWLHTGDIGRIQRGGYIEILDRAKDLIIVKGLNVYSREVEEVLLMHRDLAEAAVIGEPDEDGDEVVKAFVVVKEGRKVAKADLMSLCKEHLAAYKWPREIIFASFLPKNTIGKVLKRELKQNGTRVAN